MQGKLENDRRLAVERYLAREPVEKICRSLGKSQRWFFKWLARYRDQEDEWYREESRRPRSCPASISGDIQQTIEVIRKELSDSGQFSGAQAIVWRMEELKVGPVPSVSTVGRVLVRRNLTSRRKGRYEPKGTFYPSPAAAEANDVHQSDYAGPCYLRGGPRFYSLNSVDLATGRCAVQPVTQGRCKAAPTLWAIWLRLGFPRYQQLDNDPAFYGSPSHPRGMGKLVRVCLMHDVEPVFIPLREPWRNGVVEKFNHNWRGKFLRRVEMSTSADLDRESRAFEVRHNRYWRYSKLGGRTPLQALAASDARLRFPESPEPPAEPLAKPERGRYHVVRFIRSDGKLDMFGEGFAMPSEAVHEYVWATVDVASQRLQLHVGGRQIDEREYRLR